MNLICRKLDGGNHDILAVMLEIFQSREYYKIPKVPLILLFYIFLKPFPVFSDFILKIENLILFSPLLYFMIFK